MRNWHIIALVLCITSGLCAQQTALASDLEEGSKLYAAKEYTKALPFLERAAQFSPMQWQPHYYLANTNLALGRMSAAKYEYELCRRATTNPAIIAKCQEGIARADKHSTQVRTTTPATTSTAKSKSDDEAPAEGNVKLTDAQVAAKRRREDIMKGAREAVAKVKQEAKDQLESEKANANQRFRYEDGRIGTDLDDARETEIQKEAEEKCKRIMREAEAKAGK